MLRKLLISLGVIALVVIAFAGYLVIRPPGDGTAFDGAPRPTADYAAAMSRFNAGIAEADGPEVDSRCHSFVLEHGAATDRVAVLLHGYTNCPYGMRRLAEALFAEGYNVVVPRLPHQGLADKLSPEGATWTAEEIVAVAGEAVDVAAGLGRRVTVVGLSAGGVAATWIAQTRSDVDRVVALQPLLGYQAIPVGLERPAVNLVLTIPDVQLWWDSREIKTPPDYGYPKFGLHASAQIIRLGEIVADRAAKTTPGAAHIVVTNNPNDTTVDASQVSALADEWAGHGADAHVYTWDGSLGVGHNMIDDEDAGAKLDAVYPILVQLAEGTQGGG